MIDPNQIKKWRLAHVGLEIPDEAIATVAPFPSLYANDLAVYLEAKGQPDEVVQLVRDLNREALWAYDNWKKCQDNSDPEKLLMDMINNARTGGAEYGFVTKFLRDYAAANNIKVGPLVDNAKPAWMDGLTAINNAGGAVHPAYGQAAPVMPPEPQSAQ
jgi:hypothetical protein